jgi:hypothetical protein
LSIGVRHCGRAGDGGPPAHLLIGPETSRKQGCTNAAAHQGQSCFVGTGGRFGGSDHVHERW